MTEEYQSPEVSFKYYLPENDDEVWMHIHASDMYSILHDIDQHCRGILKYDNKATEDKRNLAEHIRNLIHESIDMDRMR